MDSHNINHMSKTTYDRTDEIIIAKLKAERDALRAENEKLREAIGLLQNWVKAYPLDMFPEPDLKLARKLLTDGGVSYDALNVYSMRHVINGVGRIIDEALNEMETCPAWGGSAYMECMASNGGMTQIPCANCGGSGEVTK